MRQRDPEVVRDLAHQFAGTPAKVFVVQAVGRGPGALEIVVPVALHLGDQFDQTVYRIAAVYRLADGIMARRP